MSSRKTSVPAIPKLGGGVDQSVARAVGAITEATEVGLGRRGDPLDRFVTVRELGDAGLGRIVIQGGRAAIGGGGTPGTGAPLPGNEPPNFGGNDFTPPPRPTGVQARGVADSMMVMWDTPGYANHAYTEVFFLTFPRPNNYGNMINEQAGFRTERAVSVQNPHINFAGSAEGTLFMHRDLPRLSEPGVNPLDAALNPTRRYYWVRFVSYAGVPGPFHSSTTGAVGIMTINPGLVLDAMIANVSNTEIYTNLRGLLGPSAQQIAANGGLVSYIQTGDAAVRQEITALAAQIGDLTWLGSNTVSSIVQSVNGTLQNLWSVRMQQSIGGISYTAGFGLGMTTDPASGTTRSTFLVNADQFAVMGSTSPAVHLVGFSRDFAEPDVANVTWETPFSVPGTLPPSIFNVATNNRVVMTVDGTSQYAGLNNIEAEVIGLVGPATVAGRRQWTGRIRADNNTAWPVDFVPRDEADRFGLAMLGPTSMPFIIDTTRNVVGIRGSLIVNGLIRANQGDFDSLTADSAFIRALRADIVNANVIVGTRIIAGVPPNNVTGALSETDLVNYASNYIIELNNPTSGRPPLRYYKPRSSGVPGIPDGTPHTVAELDQFGNFMLGGNLSVGGNGVIRTNGANLFSAGGAGADGTYAMWIGPTAQYGPNGGGRSEANGVLWVKDNGRAGLNADFFLGNNAFALPMLASANNPGAAIQSTGSGPRAASIVTTAVSNTGITVRPLRSGQAAVTWVQATGLLYSFGTSGNGNAKRFRIKLELVGSQGAMSGITVQDYEVDDWSPETYPFNLAGAVQVPAGSYFARVTITNVEDRPVSIIQGWNAMAMQVTASGGLVPAP